VFYDSVRNSPVLSCFNNFFLQTCSGRRLIRNMSVYLLTRGMGDSALRIRPYTNSW